MKNELTIEFIELDIAWENPQINREHLSNKLKTISNSPDLIVLPEMFTTGFTMNKDLAETMNGDTLKWMQLEACNLNCAIVGSILINDNNLLFNRAIFMKPNGEYDSYDKHHLFVLSEEYKALTAGTTKAIIEWKGWNIALFICYELRFPVWSWNFNTNNQPSYDIAIYMANWPAIRQHHWNTLLTARAIENQCYVVGVNRIGVDENRIEYRGGSVLLDYAGNAINRTILKDKLYNFRTKIFPLA